LLRGISIDWSLIGQDSYLRQIDALRGLTGLDFVRPVTFFVGENGSGKSTLLEAIAVAAGFNPEGGTRNYNFSTRDTHSELYRALRLSRGARRQRAGYFLRAESFYNVATMEEEYARAGGEAQRFHLRSHGESFIHLAQQYFKPDGLYLMDEPEAALSPQRQLTMLREIYDCAASGSQFLIVTHSPILLALPDAQILSLDGDAVRPCDYEDTDSYRITAMIVKQRERLIAQLLSD